MRTLYKTLLFGIRHQPPSRHLLKGQNKNYRPQWSQPFDSAAGNYRQSAGTQKSAGARLTEVLQVRLLRLPPASKNLVAATA